VAKLENANLFSLVSNDFPRLDCLILIGGWLSRSEPENLQSQDVHGATEAIELPCRTIIGELRQQTTQHIQDCLYVR
jgi:hypothetical protein